MTMKIYFLILGLTLSFFAMSQTSATQKKIRFLALGDSYTIGESVAEHQRWPVQLMSSLRKRGYTGDDPTIIATTGWRTDDLKRAIQAANLQTEYDLVSLLIGVNNQYQGKSAESYTAEFEDLLKTAIRCAGGDKSRVFVVSIPDYGFTPFGKEKQQAISKEIDEFNAVNKQISEKYGIQYFYITDISRRGLREPELVAEDGLHPSGKMYGEWVTQILTGLKLK